MNADAGRLRLNDALRVSSVGLRARPTRAALSALGIAIGTAAIVAVLGLSSSSQAGLLAEIDRLGTNMLTLEAGQSLTGQEAQLPREAPGRITLLDRVERVAHTALIKGENVYRSRLIPVTNTGGLQVRATSLNLPSPGPPASRSPCSVRLPRNGSASTEFSPTSGSGWRTSGSTSQASWNPRRSSPTSTTAP
jgi:putative ABC transport system permease protein